VLAVVIGAIAGNLGGAFNSIGVLVLATPVAMLSWFARRFYWGSLVIGVLVLFASVTVGLFGLSRLDGFTDFAPGLLSVVAGFALITGSVIAIVQRRRDARRAPTPRQRWAVRAVGFVVAVLAIASAVVSARGQTTLGSVPGAIVVDMKNDRFDPTSLRIRPGEHVNIIAHNLDDYAHTFTIDDLELDAYVGPLATRLITFTAPERAASLELTCAVSGHNDMRGIVTVDG
jgi:plastocyanin